MWLDTGIVIAYILLLIVMSLRGGRNVRNAADFTASGGRYGTLIIFATLSASYVGGGYSSGNAAKAFAGGIGTTLTLFGFSLAMILIGRFLVPGVERFPQAKTVGGIVGTAYGRSAGCSPDFSPSWCRAGVVGAQMEAIGLVFHVLLGVESHVGILLGCGIVLLYTTFGGLQSVIVADILQFVLLAGGMPLLLFMGLREAGGIEAVLSAVPAEYFNPFNGTTAAGFFSLFLTMMFGEALAPPYTQRLLIGRKARGTARATILSGLFPSLFHRHRHDRTVRLYTAGYQRCGIGDAGTGTGGAAARAARGGDGGDGLHYPVGSGRLSQRRGGQPCLRRTNAAAPGNVRPGTAYGCCAGSTWQPVSALCCWLL